jgi:hypothetical protein
MKGNFHVRFLGEEAMVTLLPYPTQLPTHPIPASEAIWLSPSPQSKRDVFRMTKNFAALERPDRKEIGSTGSPGTPVLQNNPSTLGFARSAQPTTLRVRI